MLIVVVLVRPAVLALARDQVEMGVGLWTLDALFDRFFEVRVRVWAVLQPGVRIHQLLVLLLVFAERPFGVDQIIRFRRSHKVDQLALPLLPGKEKPGRTHRNFLAAM